MNSVYFLLLSIALLPLSCSSKLRGPLLDTSLKKIAFQTRDPDLAKKWHPSLKIQSYSRPLAVVLADDLIWNFRLGESFSNGPFSPKISALLKSKGQNPFHQLFMREIGHIKITTQKCPHHKVACLSPQSPRTLHLTGAYFKLNRPSRLASLIHEAFHHFRPQKHVKCPSLPQGPSFCDRDLDSAFGAEAYYLQHMLLNCGCHGGPLEKQLKRRLQLVLNRINLR